MRLTFAISVIVVCALAPAAAAAPAAKKAAVVAPVTISGCLEREDESYRLTETTGAQAPKSRSWKTGFVTKRSADLDIVDVSKKLKLKDHVGHRVAMTGHVKEGDFRVQSMRHLAPKCSN
jgi:hypothetical protein